MSTKARACKLCSYLIDYESLPIFDNVLHIPSVELFSLQCIHHKSAYYKHQYHTKTEIEEKPKKKSKQYLKPITDGFR